jgi:single-stranded DNA-specific DHH superfamily exonuclease
VSFTAFIKAAGTTARILKENEPFQVITHGDVDGVASGALAYRAFDCDIIIQKRLQLDQVDHSKFTLFLDLGSSQLLDIKKGFENAFVVDHHPANEYTGNVLNPWMFGIDGTRFLCTAATLYMVVKQLGPAYEKLSYLGVVGALGDRQKLEKENNTVLQDAISRGILKNGILFGKYDLTEFVQVVNACCRNTKKELAMKVCLLNHYEQGKKELEKYNNAFNNDLKYLEGVWDIIQEKNKNRQALYIYDTNITKKYAGELATWLARKYNQAVIIMVKDAEGIKISGRGTPDLVNQGLHLGKAFEGFGGGHNIAAGAFLKDESVIETFIQTTNKRLLTMVAPVTVRINIPVPDADTVMKALSVDDQEYNTVHIGTHNGYITGEITGQPGTVKNVTDDIIACIISAIQMMEGESC